MRHILNMVCVAVIEDSFKVPETETLFSCVEPLVYNVYVCACVCVQQPISVSLCRPRGCKQAEWEKSKYIFIYIHGREQKRILNQRAEWNWTEGAREREIKKKNGVGWKERVVVAHWTEAVFYSPLHYNHRERETDIHLLFHSGGQMQSTQAGMRERERGRETDRWD